MGEVQARSQDEADEAAASSQIFPIVFYDFYTRSFCGMFEFLEWLNDADSMHWSDVSHVDAMLVVYELIRTD